MQVLYSIGVKFAGGGIGSIAYQEARALSTRHVLARLLCGAYQPSDIPTTLIKAMGWPSRFLRRLDTFDPKHRVAYLHNVLYDLWSTRHFVPADVLLVWGTFGRRAIQHAAERGMITVVHWPSSHPHFRRALFIEEHQRTGLGAVLPERNHARAVAEIESADCVVVPSEFVAETFLQHGFPPETAPERWHLSRSIRRTSGNAERNPLPFRRLGASGMGRCRTVDCGEARRWYQTSVATVRVSPHNSLDWAYTYP